MKVHLLRNCISKKKSAEGASFETSAIVMEKRTICRKK